MANYTTNRDVLDYLRSRQDHSRAWEAKQIRERQAYDRLMRNIGGDADDRATAKAKAQLAREAIKSGQEFRILMAQGRRKARG